jgi:predicted transcriptional regulator
MNEIINEKVSVITKYDRMTGVNLPVKLLWQGRERRIIKLGFHHTKREGRKLLHIFTVTDGHLAYYLSLDTETLHWTLMEVSDGAPG